MPPDGFTAHPRACGAFQRDQDHVGWRVWAPKASRVDLVLEGDRAETIPMSAQGDGYYYAEREHIAEERYAYRLDGGPPRPDPCSRWQPEGVHRASAVLLPAQFTWTDKDYAGVAREDIVFYELHVGTFTKAGTFDAIIPRLQQLKELGVTALELMPLAEFPGARNWGYDGVQLYAVESSYGGPHGLARLVDAAHAMGLAVFLDVVYNHFGPEGNYVGEFGPYYSERYRTAWGPAFNFDGPGSDAVREFVLDNVTQWIDDFHLDGLRLDAVHAMYDISPLHILGEIKLVADAAAERRGRTATIVVESLLNDVRMLLPEERGGHNLDAEWNEDFHHAVLAYLTGERHGKYVDFGAIDHLPRVLNETFLLSGGYSRFRGRRWGRPAGGLSGDRFVIGIQNHDHAGNRAGGERIGTLFPPPVQRLAACLMFLSPHLPLLFMGEEYGEDVPFLFFCSFQDEGLIESVRQGRRRDYSLQGEVPDPQDPRSFEASRLSWSWPEGTPRAGLRQLYADLLAARRIWPALRDFTRRHARILPGENPAVLELIRGDVAFGPQAVAAYCNLSAAPQQMPVLPPEARLLFRSSAAVYSGGAAPPARGAELAPYECVVYGPASYAMFGV